MTVYAAVVIGYGRSGKAALSALKEQGMGPLLCVERRAPEAGAPQEVRWETTAAGLLPGFPGEPHTLTLRSAQGEEMVQANHVLICTGGHEASREELDIPGSRPSGIMTSTMAEDLMDLGLLPGRRIVLYGHGSRAQRVAQRLRQMGAALLRELDPKEVELVRVDGTPRLKRIQIAERAAAQGETSSIDCDTLIISSALVPSISILKGTGIELEASTHGPRVDEHGHTNLEGIWAAGTAVAPFLEGEFSAESGKAVALAIAQGAAAAAQPVHLLPGKGLKWVAPQVVDGGVQQPVPVCALTESGKAVRLMISTAELKGRDQLTVNAEVD